MKNKEEIKTQSVVKAGVSVILNGGNCPTVTHISEFPHTDEIVGHRKDPDGKEVTFYKVDGVSVQAYNEETDAMVLAPVTCWSEHKNLELEIVQLRSGRHIITDDDPRAVYGIPSDTTTMELERFTPSEALRRKVFVPLVYKDGNRTAEYDELNGYVKPEHTDDDLYNIFDFDEAFERFTPLYDLFNNAVYCEEDQFNIPDDSCNVPMDFEFGQFIGCMAGDGWWDHKNYNYPRGLNKAGARRLYLADLEGSNHNFVLNYLAKYVDKDVKAYKFEHRKTKENDRYGDSDRYAYCSPKFERVARTLSDIMDGSRDTNTAGSGNKKLPMWVLSTPRATRWGVIAGVLATDGSISVNGSKGNGCKRQLQAAITSTSLRLLEDVQAVLKSVDVASTISFSKVTQAGNASWILNISTPDLKREQHNLKGMCNKRKLNVLLDTPVDINDANAVGIRKVVFPAVIADTVLAWIQQPRPNELEGDAKKRAVDAANLANCVRRGKVVGYVTEGVAKRIRDYIFNNRFAHNSWIVPKDICLGFLARAEYAEDNYAEGKVYLKAEQIQTLHDAVRDMFTPALKKHSKRAKSIFDAAYKIVRTLAIRHKDRYVSVNALGCIISICDSAKEVGLDVYPEFASGVYNRWVNISTGGFAWDAVVGVQKTGQRYTGYDITVPGYETFVGGDGIVRSNTINVHVPATDEAVKETYEALMPSAHPYDDRSGDTIKPKLKQEQVLGLYDIATRPASGTYRFATTAEALKAVREGSVPLDADLEIGDLKPVEKQASLVSFINNKAKDIAMTPVSGIMSMELPNSVDSDGDGVPDEITPEEASDMLRELYGIDLPDADASTLRDVQGIVSWLKARREGEKVAEYVDPSMDMGERTVSGETLKALELMYGVSFPDIMKGGAKAVDVVRYLAKELKIHAGLDKNAAGKMMEVAFENLEQSGEVGERRTKGIVYMPDCEEYRGILSGDDRKAKAKLVQKFVLNQAPGVVYAACDAYVVK